MRDGAFFGLLTSKGDQLAELLGRNLRGPSWSGSIAESFDDREIVQRDLLPPNPAHAPTAHGIDTGPHFAFQFVHSFFLRLPPKSFGLVEPVVVAYGVGTPTL